MKKIISLIVIIATIASCTKKENTADGNTANTNNNTIDTPLIEMNIEQVSNIVTPKQNDTIYITNFFATWCGPCVREIPHFKEKMEELKNEKVKFTFVNLDSPQDWNTNVSKFANEFGLQKNIVLFNTENLTPDFFSKNFKTWDGSAIPFTLITKGDKKEEFLGMMSKEELTNKINSLK